MLGYTCIGAPQLRCSIFTVITYASPIFSFSLFFPFFLSSLFSFFSFFFFFPFLPPPQSAARGESPPLPPSVRHWDVCPRVDNQTSGDTLQNVTRPLSGKIAISQLSIHYTVIWSISDGSQNLYCTINEFELLWDCSVVTDLRMCLAIVCLSTIFPELGSKTGSFMRHPMIGSR